ncbi:uncharacterized protein SEPMUDRAFT_105498 [Sphaerulina musiva SO2202]|uniref:Uncharacterized protein n=1 Tax=Sphaerulina musiva (strain SO2202) TaxID=692275 RepID=M3DAU8_SPHMS|nr:uncharacterized protein SEPMUDRAFT_105498 [Sphaerulina musiva SO2202]EMF15210.1 hypothetical protein SEPMUDRAFT_105498 [Sphaerulina musiva SO2202]
MSYKEQEINSLTTLSTSKSDTILPSTKTRTKNRTYKESKHIFLNKRINKQKPPTSSLTRTYSIRKSNIDNPNIGYIEILPKTRYPKILNKIQSESPYTGDYIDKRGYYTRNIYNTAQGER